MPTWAAVANVQSRLTYKTIDANSSPSSDDVDDWLEEAEARIVGVLRAAGLSVDYSDTQSVRMITNAAADYATGQVRLAWGSGTGSESETDAGLRLIERFDAFIEDLRRNPMQVGSELSAGGSVSDAIQHVRSHVEDNDDNLSVAGGDFEPKFAIDGINY